MSFVTNLRNAAQEMKTNKAKSAAEFLAGCDHGHRMTQRAINVATCFLRIYQASTNVVGHVLKNSGVRQQAATIVANAIGDAASRMNEVANLVEAISKDQSVTDMFALVQDEAKHCEEEIKGYNQAIADFKNRKVKAPLTVV